MAPGLRIDPKIAVFIVVVCLTLPYLLNPWEAVNPSDTWPPSLCIGLLVSAICYVGYKRRTGIEQWVEAIEQREVWKSRYSYKNRDLIRALFIGLYGTVVGDEIVLIANAGCGQLSPIKSVAPVVGKGSDTNGRSRHWILVRSWRPDKSLIRLGTDIDSWRAVKADGTEMAEVTSEIGCLGIEYVKRHDAFTIHSMPSRENG